MNLISSLVMQGLLMDRSRSSARSGNVRPHPLLLAALFVILTVGCGKRRTETRSVEDKGQEPVVAQIDGHAITLAEFRRQIMGSAGARQVQAQSRSEQQRLLESLVRFEVMAKEAKDRGYDKDPEVVRTTKQQMISKLAQDEPTLKVAAQEISAASIQEYYSAHLTDFVHPERLRILLILVKDEVRSKKVFAEAKKLSPTDDKGFRDLVSTYSEDKPSRDRGGAVDPFERSSELLPKAVINAAFRLKGVNDLSPPVGSENGNYILRLVQRIPGSNRTLEDARGEIERRLASDLSSRRADEWAVKIRSKHNVRIFQDKTRHRFGGTGDREVTHPGDVGCDAHRISSGSLCLYCERPPSISRLARAGSPRVRRSPW